MTRAGTVVALCIITPILVAIPTLAILLQDPGYTTLEVRPNVHVIRGSGANTTVFQSPLGLFVIDAKTGQHASALMKTIRTLGRGSRPAPDPSSPGDHNSVRYLLNTHSDHENCGGNKEFSAATTVIAHDKSEARMHSAGERTADISFSQRLRLKFGGETITCHYKGTAHTDGDVIVHFESAQVLVVGGLIANQSHPLIRRNNGCDVFRWLDALRSIQASFEPEGLTIIPGDGPPGGIELVTEQIDYLEDLIFVMRAAHRHGLSREEAVSGCTELRQKLAMHKGPHLEANLAAIYDILAS